MTSMPSVDKNWMACLLQEQNADLQIEDRRNNGSKIDVTFQGQLREHQMKAARNLLEHEIGTLVASTAFGKTVVGAQLLEQWRERLAAFLNISTKEIGVIGGGRSKSVGPRKVSHFTNRQNGSS
jgi:superfamily II DNA or RNA helicase